MTQELEMRFIEQSHQLDTSATSPLSALRAEGLKSFREQGFPNSRMEEWRTTDINPIRNINLSYLQKIDSPQCDQQALTGAWWRAVLKDLPRVTSWNGHFAANSKHPDVPCVDMRILTDNDQTPTTTGAVPGCIAELDEYPFAALNTAFLEQALCVTAAANDGETQPALHVAHCVSAKNGNPHVHPRLVIHVQPNASLRLIESTCGVADQPYLVNTVTEIVLEEGASLEHIRIQDDAPGAFSFGNIYVRQAANARYVSFALNMGAAIARNEFLVDLKGEHAECVLNGLYTGSRSQLLDTHSIIRHSVPHCTSSELYKGIMDGDSRGVFRGLIHVLPHAIKTSAYQTSRALLLSKTAKVHAKPQLLIFNDDVKCSHGATVGGLDPDAFFFLQSRGLSPSRARGILTAAFGGEPFRELDFSELTSALTDRLREQYAE